MRQRLDQTLVARGLVATRSRASDLVQRGRIKVDDRVVIKAGERISHDAKIEVSDDSRHYVSRGALKLAHALAVFGFGAEDLIALDAGSSTGGFTQILIENGAARVYSADVGHGQLHESLVSHPRVVALEGQDVRKLTRGLIPEPLNIIVADVSFISLTKALPAALELAAPDAWLVALIKPQFEVGRGGVGKGGIVRDASLREKAVADVTAWLMGRAGWRIEGVISSPIEGGSGNKEFLIGARFNV